MVPCGGASRDAIRGSIQEAWGGRRGDGRRGGGREGLRRRLGKKNDRTRLLLVRHLAVLDRRRRGVTLPEDSPDCKFRDNGQHRLEEWQRAERLTDVVEDAKEQKDGLDAVHGDDDDPADGLDDAGRAEGLEEGEHEAEREEAEEGECDAEPVALARRVRADGEEDDGGEALDDDEANDLENESVCRISVRAKAEPEGVGLRTDLSMSVPLPDGDEQRLCERRDKHRHHPERVHRLPILLIQRRAHRSRQRERRPHRPFLAHGRRRRDKIKRRAGRGIVIRSDGGSVPRVGAKPAGEGIVARGEAGMRGGGGDEEGALGDEECKEGDEEDDDGEEDGEPGVLEGELIY